jgi:raffinose/stachyose/melibiose transport system permease protein
VNPRQKKLSAPKILAYCFAMGWALMTLYPLLVTVLSSVKSNEEIFGRMFALPKAWHLEFYYESFVKARMSRYILNSLFLATSTTTLVAVIGSMAAYVLARTSFKFVKPIYLLFLVGVMIPLHSTIIPIARIVGAIKGMDNYLVLILVYATFQLPQAIFLIAGFMKGIDREIEEAATIDGCTLVGTLFKIMLPISTSIIFTASILAFISVYSELIFSVILLSSPDLYPVSRGLMYFTGDHTQRMGPIFASLIMAALPMVCVYIFAHEHIQRGMLAGAVKG